MANRLNAPARRDQLRVVAAQCFAANGYHVTTMNEVAQAAGVTKPVVYQHFSSKRALYLDVLADIGDRLRREVADAMRAASTPHAQVEAGFFAYFGFFRHEPAAFQVLFGDAARGDDEFVHVVQRVEADLADSVADLITIGSDVEHRRMLAFGIVGLAEGSSRHWFARGLDIEPPELARRMANLVWYGLRAIPAP